MYTHISRPLITNKNIFLDTQKYTLEESRYINYIRLAGFCVEEVAICTLRDHQERRNFAEMIFRIYTSR